MKKVMFLGDFFFIINQATERTFHRIWSMEHFYRTFHSILGNLEAMKKLLFFMFEETIMVWHIEKLLKPSILDNQ